MLVSRFGVEEDTVDEKDLIYTNQDLIEQLKEDGAEDLSGDLSLVSLAISQERNGVRGGIWLDLQKYPLSVEYYLFFAKYGMKPVYYYVSSKDGHISAWFAKGSSGKTIAIKEKWKNDVLARADRLSR